MTELDQVRERQQEIRETIAVQAATIAAIKSSRVYRLSSAARRLFPARPAPPIAAPAARPSKSASPETSELARARQELARLEGESYRVRQELHHLQLSRPRRLWLAARNRAQMLLHPFWTIGAAARVIGGRPAIRGVRLGWDRFRRHSLALRAQPPIAQQTNRPHAADAIRWLGPIRISGRTEPSLSMHPTSSSSYLVRAQPGARVEAQCALLPSAWSDNHGGVAFEIAIENPDGSGRETRSIAMNPGDRFVDRRWRTLSLALPPSASGSVVVRLSTRLPAGASDAHAWSVWGEPRLQWPRTSAEMWRSVAVLASRIRASGIGGTLRYIRGVQAADEDAVRYRQWIEANTPSAAALVEMAAAAGALAYRPRISVITPVFNTDPQMLRACIESVRAQAYPDWELCLADDASTAAATLSVIAEYASDPRIRVVHLPQNGGIAAASNAALAVATGEFLALLDHDDELAPDALYEMVRVLNREPDADFVYSDEDKLGPAGERCDPYFKPDWSPEHFRSCMYTCHLMVLRASLVREIGGFHAGFDGAQDYDLVLRVIERTTRIVHVPKILYHWRKSAGSTASSGLAKTWAIDAGERALQEHIVRTGRDAVVVPGPGPGLFRMRYRIAGKPLVSILIPTAGGTRTIGERTIDLIVNSVGSIVNKTSYDHYEIVIAHSGLPDATAEFLNSIRSIPVRQLHLPQPDGFNFARTMNVLAGHAAGEHLLLLNDDTEVITGEWIEAMLEYSQQPEIGGVGAKLLYPDGRIQHIGIVMGVSGMAAHAFHSHPGSTPGYGASAWIIRNYSAVTAACMMTRREVYQRLGGFDERFRLDFNDVDYCLRVRQAGYRLVYTPYAELYHLEMSTSGRRPWQAEEVESMHRAWADVVERDPYYNPNLTRDYPDFRVRV